MALTVERVREAAASAAADPLRWWRPTAPQQAFFDRLPLRGQLRGPNQAGKTEALAALLIDFVLRRGRWTKRWLDRWPGQRLEVWVVCASWQQSAVVQGKVYDLMPRAALIPETNFTRKRGFAGGAFETVDGCLVRFVTSNQDNVSLASATLHAVFVDEPPIEEAWSELCARVKDSGGPVWMFYSPINRPVEWLRERVERGEIEEVHFELSLENQWPIGALLPFQSQAKIDQFIADTPVMYREQRIKAAWNGVTVDRWLTAFDSERHMIPTPTFETPTGVSWKFGVGMDYGTQAGKMAAVLVFVQHYDSDDPLIIFVDEVFAGPKEVWEQADLARAIRDMLTRNDLSYHEIDLWIGDRSAIGRRVQRKVDNASMYYALQREFKVRLVDMKRVEQTRKWNDSLRVTIGRLNGRFMKNRARVVSRCERLTAFFSHFRGDPHDPLKDVGDAARYAALGLLGVTRSALPVAEVKSA